MNFEFIVTLTWTKNGAERRQTVLGDYSAVPTETAQDIRQSILWKVAREVGIDLSKEPMIVLFMDFTPNVAAYTF